MNGQGCVYGYLQGTHRAVTFTLTFLVPCVGSWGGGPTGGYPAMGLDNMSYPGYGPAMVSSTQKQPSS